MYEKGDVLMNPKIFFGLIFGMPTLILWYIYYNLGIHNLWQLFLFCWMVIMLYIPGIVTGTYYIRNRIRNSVQKTLVDFIDIKAV